MNFDTLWDQDGPPPLLSDDSNSSPADWEGIQQFQKNSIQTEQVQAVVAAGGLLMTVLSFIPGANVVALSVGAVAAGYGVIDVYDRVVNQNTEQIVTRLYPSDTIEPEDDFPENAALPPKRSQPMSLRRDPFKNYEPYVKTQVKKKAGKFLLWLPLLLLPPIIFRRRRKGNR